MFDDAPLASGLTVYGLVDFPGEVVGRGRAVAGAVGLVDFPGNVVGRGRAVAGAVGGVAATTHSHVRYKGSGGELVVVASSVAEDREAMRYFVLSNMVLMLGHDDDDDTNVQGKDPREVFFPEIAAGTYAWAQRSLLVVGRLVPFEVHEIGRRWAAVGEMEGTHVGLYASDFPVERVHVVPLTPDR